MGFSNRSWDATIQILEEFKIQPLVDLRTLPVSKPTPQFNIEHMKDVLPRAGIEYVYHLTKFVKSDGVGLTYPSLL